MGIGLRGPRPHDASGQRRAVFAAALVACLAALSAHAWGTNLRATVLDLQSGRPAQPLHVKLEFDAEPQAGATPLVTHQDREVGRVSSVAWLPESAPGAPLVGRWIGLGVLRREVNPGSMVRAG